MKKKISIIYEKKEEIYGIDQKNELKEIELQIKLLKEKKALLNKKKMNYKKISSRKNIIENDEKKPFSLLNEMENIFFDKNEINESNFNLLNKKNTTDSFDFFEKENILLKEKPKIKKKNKKRKKQIKKKDLKLLNNYHELTEDEMKQLGRKFGIKINNIKKLKKDLYYIKKWKIDEKIHKDLKEHLLDNIEGYFFKKELSNF